MVRVDFSKLPDVTNPVYYPYLTDYRRFQIYKGGAGAGKSVHVSEKIVYNMIVNRGYNGMACRKTGVDNHTSTFSEMQRTIGRWNLNELFTFNRSRGAEEIICKLNNNRLIFRGMDDVEKVKSITFPTGDLIFVWCEEANQFDLADIRQLNLRLRGTTGPVPKHIIMSFNPIDIDSWIKTEYFDHPIEPSRGYVLETTYRDNRFLDDTYKQELENLQYVDMYYYNVYVLNQWGSLSTAKVFQNLQIHEFELPEYHMQNIRHGVDFGFNHANAYEGMGFKDGELYIYKEVYGKHQMIEDFINDVKKIHVPSYPIVGDSASPDKIQAMNNAGLTVYQAKKGPGSVLRVVDWLKAVPVIHIHATRCPNAAKEMPRIKYRELKDGSVLEEIVEIDDDTLAAIRYAVEDLAENVEAGHFVRKRHPRR